MLDSSACGSFLYEDEAVEINQKQQGWPVKGQLRLSSFALVQERLATPRCNADGF